MKLCTFYLLMFISDPPFPEATFFVGGGFLGLTNPYLRRCISLF